MYIINKIIGHLTNPVAVAWIGVLFVICLRLAGRRRLASWLLAVSVAWTWLWATPLMVRCVGAPLEREFLCNGRVPSVESYPTAEVIEVHGGAMGIETNLCDFAEMSGSADRVWHAVRLWKAGKAPLIYVTGGGVKLTTAGLLKDFGIPTNAVVFAEEPRNTEEEARFIAGAMNKAKAKGEGEQWNCSISSSDQQNKNDNHHCSPSPSIFTSRPKVLVVTSAWHMRRTMMMYAKYAPNIEAIPAPCDFENCMRCQMRFGLWDFIPDHCILAMNCVSAHEWVGIFGYKWLRK